MQQDYPVLPQQQEMQHIPQEKFPNLPDQQMNMLTQVPYNTAQPDLPHFEKFSHECDTEQHIGTFTTTTYLKENCWKIVIRVLCYCRWLRPSQTHATHLSNKRIVAQLLNVTSETIFDNSISYAFLRDLRGIDVKKKTIPLPLYAKFPAIAWMFPVLYVIPFILEIIACGIAYSSGTGYGVLQLFTFLIQLVLFSVIVLLIHNQLTKKSSLELIRTMVFCIWHLLQIFYSFAIMVAGFASASKIIPDTTRKMLNSDKLYQSEFGGIFLGLSIVLAISYVLSFGMYPSYAHHCKTKVECTYDTSSGSKKQEIMLQHETADQFRTALFNMKKDIVGTNELPNFPIQRSVQV